MTSKRVIVADDDQAIRTVVTQALTRQGFQVESTGMASTLWKWVEEGHGDAAVIDVVLPDQNTLDLLPQIKRRRPDLPIIVMSAQNTILTAVRATERGAFDYLPKPFDLDQLVAAVRRATSLEKTEPRGPSALIAGEENLPIIGRSAPMQDIYRMIARLVSTDLTVLVNGESGTGKELIAQALHDFGQRRNGPFVAVNMAAIPRDLIESELFGHEKGSFTGAYNRRVGRFEEAEGGTLFLDEIGDMPTEAQTRLLRVLQQGEFVPVGGRQALGTNVRVVAATHRDLNQLVSSGAFREDLYYRLNVVPLRLPPLRERAEDIPALVEHFVQQAVKEGMRAPTLTTDALNRLKGYRWPGNVRELENLVRRLSVFASEDLVDAEAIEQVLQHDQPAADRFDDEATEVTIDRLVGELTQDWLNDHEGGERSDLYAQMLELIEKPLISRVLQHTRGNQVKAAVMLGLNRNTLRKRVRDLDITIQRGS